MSPDEKLNNQICRALDVKYRDYTAWEVGFLKTISNSLTNKFKSVSPKQKALAHNLTKDVASK